MFVSGVPPSSLGLVYGVKGARFSRRGPSNRLFSHLLWTSVLTWVGSQTADSLSLSSFPSKSPQGKVTEALAHHFAKTSSGPKCLR